MGVRNITLFKVIFKGSFHSKYVVCLKNLDQNKNNRKIKIEYEY